MAHYKYQMIVYFNEVTNRKKAEEIKARVEADWQDINDCWITVEVQGLNRIDFS